MRSMSVLETLQEGPPGTCTKLLLLYAFYFWHANTQHHTPAYATLYSSLHFHARRL